MGFALLSSCDTVRGADADASLTTQTLVAAIPKDRKPAAEAWSKLLIDLAERWLTEN